MCDNYFSGDSSDTIVTESIVLEESDATPKSILKTSALRRNSAPAMRISDPVCNKALLSRRNSNNLDVNGHFKFGEYVIDEKSTFYAYPCCLSRRLMPREKSFVNIHDTDKTNDSDEEYNDINNDND
eukprot:Pgem_evm1s14853